MPDTLMFARGNKLRRSQIAGEADLQMKAIRKAVTEGVEFLLACRAAGADAAFVSDTARGLHDVISNLEHACVTTLDNHKLHHVDPIDLAELDQIITTLERGR